MSNCKKIIIIGILLLKAVLSVAQEDKVIVAYNFLKNGNLDSAKVVIDLAVADTESVNDGQAWYIRGFVYKSIYTLREKGNRQSPLRLEGLNSFKRSLLIDTASENVTRNIGGIKYLSSTLFNDVVTSLDTINYNIGIENYDIFKDYYKLVDTSKATWKSYEIKFLLALASVYSDIYEKDKKGKSEFLNLTKDIYTKVLALDPNNIKAYYNMGILYYNQAVNLITQSEYDIDIVALNDIQDNSVKLFKDAVPFMEKANELEPMRRETLQGLSGIYFGLNDTEKSNLYKKKLQELGN